MRHNLVVTFKQSDEAVGLFGLMALLFIGLKLMGYISWSWWLILAPLWAPLALVLALLLLAGIFVVIFGLIRNYKLEQLRKRRITSAK